MMSDEEVHIFCPDCRGRFTVGLDEIIEGDLVECTLCAAEIQVLEENPIKLRLYNEENDFA